MLLNLETGRAAINSELAAELLATGWDVVTADLRATGPTAYPRDKIGRAPDHNTAEWSLWIGRPLLGQWVTDVVRLLDVLDETADRAQGDRAQDDRAQGETAVIGVETAWLLSARRLWTEESIESQRSTAWRALSVMCRSSGSDWD